MTKKSMPMYYWLRSLTIVLLIGLLFPSGSAFAQGPSPASRREAAIQSNLTPSSDISRWNANVAPMGVTGNLIQDGSFEAFDAQTADNPYWNEFDTHFGTPLCNGDACGYWLEAHPHSGSAWAWFGGVQLPEHYAYVSQMLYFPNCTSATLQFYFWIGFAQTGSGVDDVFTAQIDGTTVFSANATQKNSYPAYTLVSQNVSAFAGAFHTITFSQQNSIQDVTFNLDDISLVATCPVISGNVGVGGATLSYTDGMLAKSVTSQADGTYSLPVSNNWSGMVTPTHPCYLFSPADLSYSNVITDLVGQNYAPTFNPTPACKVTTGVFRPSNGLLYLKNSNVSGFADAALNYGLPGDYPVTGDWDGNGTDTIGIYRSGSFYLRNSNTLGFADIVFAFGQPGDQPIAGDWNNDGVDTIGIYRPSSGEFLLRTSNSGGFADIALNYGLPGDQPVTGDWDGNGTDTIGIYRSGSFYLRNENTNGFAELIFGLGNPGDMPIAGNWDALP